MFVKKFPDYERDLAFPLKAPYTKKVYSIMQMKRANKSSLNLAIVIGTLLFSVGVYSIVRFNGATKESLKQIDPTLAQSACNTSFFTVQSPAGKTFSKSCIVNGGQMYAGDLRYQFFLPNSYLDHAAYVVTENAAIKDNKTLSWSITTQQPSTLYLLTRYIPGLAQVPSWISGSYTRQNGQDLAHIDVFFKRKNDQGLIGLFDIYAKTIPAGTIQLSGASDTNVSAYSMYLAVLVPTVNSTATPIPTPSPTPVRTPSPTPSATPDPLLEEAKKHSTATDCYVVYNNGTGRYLYNVTGYVRLHPGTQESLVSGCGTDITERYNNGDPNYKEADTGLPHKHTKASNDILDIFKLP